MNRSSQRGQAAAPIIVFVGIVTLSVIFFFVFTMPQCGGAKPATTAQNAGPKPVAIEKPELIAPTPVVPQPVTPAEPPKPQKPFYAKSSQFLAAVSEKIAVGKIDETLELMSPTIPEARKEFYKKLFASGFQPVAASSSWREIGRISGQERWALPLTKPADSTVPSPTEIPPPAPGVAEEKPKAQELQVDLKLTREEGYQITGLRFSPALLAAAGSTDATLADAPDALVVSHDFITELLSKDFRGARLMTDGNKVTHEKLAGLCIVFEEGEYAMVPGSTLNVTAATSERAWALIRVKSAKQNIESEFGVEMSKDPQGTTWKVDSLDFSKLLQTYVQATDAGNVYYTPIVKSPNGGESLVVYFEYDKAELTERGLRQMQIVSELLKSDPARKMRLSGYTDALGSEDYNYVLSKKRAEAVQAKLTELGVSPEQIVSRGFGTQAPLDPNQKEDGTDNPEGRSRNRRTEIYLDF